MNGVITTRHLLLYGPLICREFGMRVYLRCLCRSLRPGKCTTFLECVAEPERASSEDDVRRAVTTVARAAGSDF